MSLRQAEMKRKTSETDVNLKVLVDGSGKRDISTGIPFLDHMLELFAKHGLFDLTINAVGDVDVDYHHTVEDVGLTLGSAFDEALGDRAGIRRYGEARVPMDEARVEVAVDLGGRPYLIFDVPNSQRCIKDIPVQLFEEFFRAFSVACRMNIHIKCLCGENTHHIVESMFKSFARALDQATVYDTRTKDSVPSTKGIL